jgi:hypothetical protein
VFSLLIILAQEIPSAKLVTAEIWFDARATIADFQDRPTRRHG